MNTEQRSELWEISLSGEGITTAQHLLNRFGSDEIARIDFIRMCNEMRNQGARHAVCCYCGHPVKYVSASAIQPAYFAHHKASECHSDVINCPFYRTTDAFMGQVYKREGKWHIEHKHLIAAVLRKSKHVKSDSVEVEPYLFSDDCESNARRNPDIYFKDINGNGFAVELTRWWMDKLVVVQREYFYREQGVNLIWLFSDNCYNRNEATFKYILFGSNKREHYNAFVLDEKAIDLCQSAQDFYLTVNYPIYSINTDTLACSVERLDEETVHFTKLKLDPFHRLPYAIETRPEVDAIHKEADYIQRQAAEKAEIDALMRGDRFKSQMDSLVRPEVKEVLCKKYDRVVAINALMTEIECTELYPDTKEKLLSEIKSRLAFLGNQITGREKALLERRRRGAHFREEMRVLKMDHPREIHGIEERINTLQEIKAKINDDEQLYVRVREELIQESDEILDVFYDKITQVKEGMFYRVQIQNAMSDLSFNAADIKNKTELLQKLTKQIKKDPQLYEESRNSLLNDVQTALLKCQRFHDQLDQYLNETTTNFDSAKALISGKHPQIGPSEKSDEKSVISLEMLLNNTLNSEKLTSLEVAVEFQIQNMITSDVSGEDTKTLRRLYSRYKCQQVAPELYKYLFSKDVYIEPELLSSQLEEAIRNDMARLFVNKELPYKIRDIRETLSESEALEQSQVNTLQQLLDIAKSALDISS